MEACGGAHRWARTLLAMGHQVMLRPAQHVRAFVLRDKTDALDAQAIRVAAQSPTSAKCPSKASSRKTTLHKQAGGKTASHLKLHPTESCFLWDDHLRACPA